MPKIITVLETIGALLIVAAFTLWSGEWWFGKRDIKVNIPYLPEVTIHR